MNSKSKTEALRIIHNCALLYRENLAHKNVLFVTLCDRNADYFEAAFLPRNYLHLTGVRTDLRSTDFYYSAVRDRLNENDFRFSGDGTTDKKLAVLPSLMKIYLTARMVGDYDYSKSLLVTDKIACTITAAMGFKKNGDSDLYVPNTALNTDMREITKNPVRRVAATFIKDKQNDKYRELTYIAKGLTIDDSVLTPVFHDKVDTLNVSASFPIPRLPILIVDNSEMEG